MSHGVTQCERFVREEGQDGSGAFERFEEGVMPQFKVRTHEITSSKSLMLVKKDPWDLVEDFYEPDKEFLYFENFDELREIITDLSCDFNKYSGIIENAYPTGYENKNLPIVRFIGVGPDPGQIISDLPSTIHLIENY